MVERGATIPVEVQSARAQTVDSNIHQILADPASLKTIRTGNINENRLGAPDSKLYAQLDEKRNAKEGVPMGGDQPPAEPTRRAREIDQATEPANGDAVEMRHSGSKKSVVPDRHVAKGVGNALFDRPIPEIYFYYGMGGDQAQAKVAHRAERATGHHPVEMRDSGSKTPVKSEPEQSGHPAKGVGIGSPFDNPKSLDRYW